MSVSPVRNFHLIVVLLIATTFPACNAPDAPKMLPDSVEHFAAVDANKDDVLSKEEFVEFVELEAEDNIGASRRIKSRKIYDRAFSNLDKNDDGAVSRDEIGAAQARLQ